MAIVPNRRGALPLFQPRRSVSSTLFAARAWRSQLPIAASLHKTPGTGMRLPAQRRFSAPPATSAFDHHCRRPHHPSPIERALRLAARAQSSFAQALVLWRTLFLVESQPPLSSLGHPPRTAADTIPDPKRSALLGSHRRERLRSDSSRHVLPCQNIAAERLRSSSLSSKSRSHRSPIHPLHRPDASRRNLASHPELHLHSTPLVQADVAWHREFRPQPLRQAASHSFAPPGSRVRADK